MDASQPKRRSFDEIVAERMQASPAPVYTCDACHLVAQDSLVPSAYAKGGAAIVAFEVVRFCPMCGQEMRLVTPPRRETSSDGTTHVFFSHTPEQEEAARSLLDWMSSTSAPSVNEVLAQAQTNPWLAGLVGQLLELLPRATGEVLLVVLTVVLTRFLTEPGLTAEDVDRLLHQQAELVKEQEYGKRHHGAAHHHRAERGDSPQQHQVVKPSPHDESEADHKHRRSSGEDGS